MGRVEEISRMLIRRFKRMKYKNVDLVPGYEETEKEYRSLRESLHLLDGTIKSLGNYEHGSNIYRNLKKGIQFLNDRASLGIYRNMDIYEEAAEAGSRLSKINGNSKFQSVGQKYRDVYTSVSKSKRCLNTRLAVIRVKLREVKNQIQEIDHLRKRSKNMRYDLEAILQDGGYNDELRDAERSEYEAHAKSTLKSMRHFIEDSELPGLMRDVSKEYKKHMEEVVDLLKFIG